ncbi:hypothetical protein AN6176.2 [Aspergillus nidulans FGSC A4]|nr:hypothetical protein AN6176.2 [Aspergillus nidulans FGSC A4]|eukprot:XP_663780.1 hypothetical protein AN6176.2 [Aspergillus nidulans FGSC A4]
MAPRSQLEIATSAVQRLVKEEASYRREAEQQKERIKKLEAQDASTDENRDYMLKQEVRCVPVPSSCRVEEGKKGAESNVEHINAAKEAIANARVAEREIA